MHKSCRYPVCCVSVYKWEIQHHRQRSRKRHSVCLNTVFTPNASWRVCLKYLVHSVTKLNKWLQITQLNSPGTLYKFDRSFCMLMYSLNQLCIMTCQRIATQRLDRHPAIRSGNNRTNVYISLLGNSQRTNGLARELSRDWFSVGSRRDRYYATAR
jgi:hypothetical protein